MVSSINIYEKNRISYIVAKKRYNYNIPPYHLYYKEKTTCYIIIGLIAMYIGVYMIICSTYK